MTNKSARARRASSLEVLWSEKFTSAYLLQIAREKSCDYLCISQFHLHPAPLAPPPLLTPGH